MLLDQTSENIALVVAAQFRDTRSGRDLVRCLIEKEAGRLIGPP
jgi:hypothetical protein